MAWPRLGLHLTPDRNLKRKALVSNVGVAIALASIALYDLLFLASGNPALIRGVWGALPSLAAFPSVGWLNAQGGFAAARWLQLSWMPLHIAMLVLLSQGTRLNAKWATPASASSRPGRDREVTGNGPCRPGTLTSLRCAAP